MSVPPVRLEVDPDPAVWLFGPTEERPPEEWLEGAVPAVCESFGIAAKRRDAQRREYVEAVLGLFARREASPLGYRLLRWRSLDDVPLPVFLGMVDRAELEPQADAWLTAADEPVVEPPQVVDVEAPAGVSVRRGTAYSDHGERGLVVGVRYVVDDGSPHAVALLHLATGSPGDVVEALDDLDALARTVRVREDTG